MRTLLAFAAVITLCTAAAQNSQSLSQPQSSTSSSTADVFCGKEEGECLKQLAGMTTRDGDHLRLRLSNGQTKTFTTRRKACEANIYEKCLQYRLMGYFTRPRQFLVDVGYLNHGGITFLVSRRTGNHISLDAPPHYSPSGKRLAAVSASESVDHGENSIQIWSSSSDPPKSEWRYTVPQDEYALYQFVSWDGDERLNMTATMHIGRNGPLQSLPVEAVHTSNGWKLMPPARNE